MKTSFIFLAFVWTIVFQPIVAVAQTAPASTLSDAQLNEGFKSGFTLIVTQALAAGDLKVPAPGLLSKNAAVFAEQKKEDLLKNTERAMADTVTKLAPVATDLIKKAVRDTKVEDAKTLLAGKSDAGTQFFSKAARNTMRDALLSEVKRITALTELAAKTRAALKVVDPSGVKGSSRVMVELNDYVCDRLIAQAFKLIADKEAAVRANPALLTGNALAQKVFAEAKK